MKCSKCSKCCKSIRYSSFECKCKQFFCLSCLPSYVHNCNYDYKEIKRKFLSEENIKIEKQKVATI